MERSKSEAGPKGGSAFAPLRNPLFRALWIATVVSNVGTWMQNVGASWLMTSLAPSPTMVALVQAATSLPMFFLALPAGALADVLDRRKVYMWTQGWMAATALLLAVSTAMGWMNAWTLLAFTFALGIGVALNTPASQAITPELVSREDLPSAIALSSAGFNVARAIGPAVGGILVAVTGPAANFALNGVSFLGALVVIYRWRREPRSSVLPAERLIGAMRAGARFVFHAPALQTVLVRAVVFILAGTALWALLPLIAREELGMGPLGYGLLLGCLGAGALAGAIVLPRARGKVSVDELVVGSTVIFAGVTVAVGFLQNPWVLGVVMFFGGSAWLAVLSSLNVATQSSIPSWVRARALAVYLLVFLGSMAFGSVLWGAVAGAVGIPVALAISAGALVVGLVATPWFRLAAGDGVDFTPSGHWAQPVVLGEPPLEGTPVLVSVEYEVEPERGYEFAELMRTLRHHRLRDGAIRWELFHDAAAPGIFVEAFLVESWVEHLRQHERATASDREYHERARAYHVGEKPPVVKHLLANRN